MNCRSVQDLVAEVKTYATDRVVYIATNAQNMSKADVELITREGFQLFNPTFVSYHAHSAEALAVEVQLMLDASTFLGWGVSLINDLVEHTRMLHGKSWCTAVEHNVTYPTWCWLQQQRLQRARPRDHLLLSARSRRDILMREDERMRSHPLILSDFNISCMPAYRREISDAARRMAALVN